MGVDVRAPIGPPAPGHPGEGARCALVAAVRPHQSGDKPAVCTAAGALSRRGGNEEGSGTFGRLSAKGAARFQPSGNP